MFIKPFRVASYPSNWISDHDPFRFDYPKDFSKTIEDEMGKIFEFINKEINYNSLYIEFAKEYLDYIGIGRNCFKQILFKSTKEFIIEYYVYNSNNEYDTVLVPTSYLTDPNWKSKENDKKRKNDREKALGSLTDHQKELLKKAGII